MAIGIPYFNRPSEIRDVIKAAYENCPPWLEIKIFIVDEGSTQKPGWDELTNLGAYRIHLWVGPKNNGIGHARYVLGDIMVNAGPFDYYAFWDDDFLPADGYFENIIDVLEGGQYKGMKVGMAGGYCHELMKDWENVDYKNPFRMESHYENSVIKHEIFMKIGNFDPRLWYYEDYDMVVRLEMLNMCFVMVPGANCIQDWRHPGGIQSNFGEQDREKLKGEMGRIFVEKYDGMIEMVTPPDWRPKIDWDEVRKAGDPLLYQDPDLRLNRFNTDLRYP